MKQFLIAIALILIVIAAAAAAVVCPDTPVGYTRTHRPAGQPANYPPPEEPACFMRSTQDVNSAISCFLCHDYLQRRSA